jgi:hypothetical protein
MMTTTPRTFLLGAFLLGANPAHDPAPASIKVDIATLHAAALTTARASGDASDAPYLLVSIVGPGSRSESRHLPDGAHLALEENQAAGTMALGAISLEPGDSVRVLISILEADSLTLGTESGAAAAATEALKSARGAPSEAIASAAIAPLTRAGVHWIGAASLLLTNEEGTARWRAYDCVKSCQVLQAPSDAGLAAKATNGVVELSGDGGTYHMQIAVRRMS